MGVGAGRARDGPSYSRGNRVRRLGNSIEIANPEVRVVVVPAIGRIMYYGFVGGENILWSDPELHGQVLPDGQPNVDEEGQYVWTNFGGDKSGPISRVSLSKSTATLGLLTTLSTARYTRLSCCPTGW